MSIRHWTHKKKRQPASHSAHSQPATLTTQQPDTYLFELLERALADHIRVRIIMERPRAVQLAVVATRSRVEEPDLKARRRDVFWARAHSGVHALAALVEIVVLPRLVDASCDAILF